MRRGGADLGGGLAGSRTFLWVVFVLACLSLAPACARAQNAPGLGITRVKDNVYRLTHDRHHSVFMVTDEGVFVADAVTDRAANYLMEVLQQRFGVPVRYLAYSHNHVDHIRGASVLTAAGRGGGGRVTVIAHEDAAEDIAMTKLPVPAPDVTFPDALSVRLGDSSVQLRYHGPNNGRGSVSMRFLPANVLFVVDWIVLGRMPYKELPGYDIHGMIRSTRVILDGPPFDRFVGGHGAMGDRSDVERYLQYLEDLYAAVRDGMLRGESLKTLQRTVRLDAYQDLPMYEEWLPLNVKGVHRMLLDMSYLNLHPDISRE